MYINIIINKYVLTYIIPIDGWMTLPQQLGNVTVLTKALVEQHATLRWRSVPLELWTNYMWTTSDAVYTSGLTTCKCFPQTSSEFGLTTKKTTILMWPSWCDIESSQKINIWCNLCGNSETNTHGEIGKKLSVQCKKKLGICKFSWKFDPNSQEAPKIQQQFDQKRILVVPQVDLFGCGSRTAAITKWYIAKIIHAISQLMEVIAIVLPSNLNCTHKYPAFTSKNSRDHLHTRGLCISRACARPCCLKSPFTTASPNPPHLVVARFLE